MEIDGVSYALGQHRGTSIASITEDTETTLTGILKGNGSKVGVQPVDVTPSSGSPNPITSGGVYNALSGKAPINSPDFSGTPTAPTAVSGTNTTQIATTAFVQDAAKITNATKTTLVGLLKGDGTNVVVQGMDVAPYQNSSNPVTSGGIYNALALKADTDHKSSATTYGVGNSSEYGHLKLSDATDSSSSTSDGVAATPAAVKAVADQIPSVPSASSDNPVMDGTASPGSASTWARGDHVHPTDTSRASGTDLTNHIAAEGSSSASGHVKLSDSTSSSSGVSDGIAATPAAVKAVMDAIPPVPTVPTAYTSNPEMDGSASPGSSTSWSRGDHVHPTDTSRASATDLSTHSGTSGNASTAGHLKLSNSTSSSSGESDGIAATPAAVKSAYDLANGKYSKPSGGIPATDLASGVIPSVPSAYTSNPAMDGTASPGSSASWSKGDHVHPTDTSRAPTNHATSATTYGVGDGTNYGHLMLSNTPHSGYGTANGVAATPKAVADARDSCVPTAGLGENLLDNAYFMQTQTRGGQLPINQRGGSTWSSSSAYTIDRWAIFDGSGTVTLGSDGITVAGSGGDLRWGTQIPVWKIVGRQITVSALVKSVTGTVGIGLGESAGNITNNWGLASTPGLSLAFTPGLCTATVLVTASPHDLSYLANFLIRAEDGASAVIQAIKVEYGGRQTLAHQYNGNWVLNETPNYDIELIKCQTNKATPATDTYANKTLATAQEIAYVESGSTASRNIAAGEYFCWNGLLYKAITSIASAAPFNVGANCEAQASGGLNAIMSRIMPFQNIGTWNTGTATISLPKGYGPRFMIFGSADSLMNAVLIAQSTIGGDVAVSTIFKGSRISFSTGNGTLIATLSASGNACAVSEMPLSHYRYSTLSTL